jgi:Carboxypeptidase regulatory-like domain
MHTWPNGRWALAVLLGCFALLALAPIADATGTGSIKGTVTNTEAKALERVMVIVFDTTTSEFAQSAMTEADGKYEVTGLVAGTYVVEFYPSFEGEYIPQYYKDKHAFVKAEAVAVTEGEPTEAIDAELHRGGKITGKVEAGGRGVEHVEVVVFGSSEEEPYFEFSETNTNGEYTVGRLPEGEYRVEFFALGDNLVPLYYEKGESFDEATKVKVKEELTETLNPVELQEGGEISGTVVNAVTHKPVANVEVEAINAKGFEFFGGYATTNEKGEYTIMGLAAGAYDVEFYFGEAGQSKTYMAPTAEDGVKVTPSQVTPIDLELVPKAPNNSGSPVVSGTPAVGELLSCSSGAWTGVTPFTFAFQWLRNGSAIAGASGGIYSVQAADQGYGLSCEVKAGNSDGTASAVSNTLSVPAAPVIAPPPPPKPQVAVSTSRIVVSGGSGHVSIDCNAAPCSGEIELTEQILTKHREGRRTVSRKETAILGEGSFSLAAGHSGTFAIHLTKAGKSMLAHAKHHRLAAALTVSVSGGQSAKRSVEISVAPKRR